MCEDCLMDATGGVEPRTTMAMRYAAALVIEVYAQPWGTVGGPLHVYVDDMNLEDHWFEDPETRAKVVGEWTDDYAGDDWIDVEEVRRLSGLTFDALAGLTQAERATVCYRQAGLFDDSGPGAGRLVGQQVLEFIDRNLDVELTDWQRHLIEVVYAAGRPKLNPLAAPRRSRRGYWF